MLLVGHEEMQGGGVIECLKVDAFADGSVMRCWARRFMRQTAIVQSVVELPALRSSRGSACLGLSSGSCAVSLRGFTQLRRARGVSVLSAAHS